MHCVQAQEIGANCSNAKGGAHPQSNLNVAPILSPAQSQRWVPSQGCGYNPRTIDFEVTLVTGLFRVLPIVAIATLYLSTAAIAGGKSEAEPIPENITLVTVDGERLRFGDLRGRVVLLDFWFSSCSPCRMALPKMRSMAKKYGDDVFVIIGVSVDEDLEMMQRFVSAEKLTWTHVWDPQREITKAFNVDSYPSYLVLDYEGRPVFLGKGWSDRKMARLTGAVKSQVKQAKKAHLSSGK